MRLPHGLKKSATATKAVGQVRPIYSLLGAHGQPSRANRQDRRKASAKSLRSGASSPSATRPENGADTVASGSSDASDTFSYYRRHARAHAIRLKWDNASNASENRGPRTKAAQKSAGHIRASQAYRQGRAPQRHLRRAVVSGQCSPGRSV
jgi:hypothetical protein